MPVEQNVDIKSELLRHLLTCNHYDNVLLAHCWSLDAIVVYIDELIVMLFYI